MVTPILRCAARDPIAGLKWLPYRHAYESACGHWQRRASCSTATPHGRVAPHARKVRLPRYRLIRPSWP